MSERVKIPFFETTIAHRDAPVFAELTAQASNFGNRYYSKEFTDLLEKKYPGYKVLLTKSGTQALELAALALNIQPGDEIIMPSFSFVGCGNAFALRGARCVFVDIDPETMNIDAEKIEAAITGKTKAILTVNYAGVSCDYERINAIAKSNGLKVIEDNAHGIDAHVNGKRLGTFGDYSILSFDYMKPLSCGEGGALLVSGEISDSLIRSYQMGTNRHDLLSGRSMFYEWKSLGSNYFLSEILSAWLLQEFKLFDRIIGRFAECWHYYYEKLMPLHEAGKLELPVLPAAHENFEYIFYIKLEDEKERSELIRYLAREGIETAFHYSPLHSSEFGSRNGRFLGEDLFTTQESKRLLRLPLYYSLSREQQDVVIQNLGDYFNLNS